MRVQVPPPQLDKRSIVRSRCEHMFVTVPRPVKQIPTLDLYWLAGLLEGEGSFIAGPPSAPRTPALVLTMADRDIVDRAAELLDCAVSMIPARRNGWRDAYCVRVRGPRAVEWMRRLRPLMGHRRQTQIDRDGLLRTRPDSTPRRRACRGCTCAPCRWPVGQGGGTAVRNQRLVHLRLTAG
jgi:hypothetical protein